MFNDHECQASCDEYHCINAEQSVSQKFLLLMILSDFYEANRRIRYTRQSFSHNKDTVSIGLDHILHSYHFCMEILSQKTIPVGGS
jgi:hypothetical protein